MENKKIKNATARVFDNMQFKSELEVRTYKTLLKYGIKPLYEEKTFLLWEGFVPTIPFYTKNTFKRKNKNIETISHNTVIDRRPPLGITYTPDFTFDYRDKHIIIECKGFQNDLFPYKFKMFRKCLEELPDKDLYEVWEIFTIKQLTECLSHLQQ